jgi:Ni,Fe-hydrogenase I cytochrome b subunit
MGSAEYGSNRKVRQVAGYIEHSSDRKTTRNEIIMNKYIKYSFVAVVILVVGFGVYYGMNNYNTQPAVEKATEVYTCSMHPEIIQDEPGNCPICGMNLVKK